MREQTSDTTRPSPAAARHEPSLKLPLAVLAGPLCWVLHFALVYLLEGFLCPRGASAVPLIAATIVTATLVCGGACVWLLLASDRWLERAGAPVGAMRCLLESLTRMLAGLALVALLWVAAGIAFLAPCVAAY